MKPPKALTDMHAALRAAYETYRDSHWRVKGKDYYGNHLLLQRLYTETEPMVDQLAERIVGLYGSDWLSRPEQAMSVSDYVQAWLDRDPMVSAASAVTELDELYPATYNDLEKRGQLTLGLDDLLMAQHSVVESHRYLLQQAMNASPMTKKLKTRLLR